MERFKGRVRELTGRARGVSLTSMVEDLSPYLRGWRGYFGFCQTPSVLRDLEQWLRRRLRAVQWTHWKHGPRRYAELHKRGVTAVWAAKAASSAHGPWRLAHAKAVKIALPNAFFDSLGLPRLLVPVRLNPPNRRMRTRMSGGVAGVRG
ncbi:MAG: putative recombinase [Gammaproteobacteria bacterium]|nr:putative recombinase [Gammaproteobacteria bacterium]